MSWAAERRALILLIVGLVAATVLAIVAISVFYETPSCADGKQNQDETGIDCGGSCAQICTANAVPPVVEFVRALKQGNRVDVIAYVENPNPSASTYGARYTIELYRADRSVITEYSSTIDLPPASSVPIFIPGAYNGLETVEQAFLAFDGASIVWTRDAGDYIVPTVTDVRVTNAHPPRITATVHNPTALPLRSVQVVATVFDEEDVVVAASRTVADLIPGQGSANIVFTWNEAFIRAPARIDVRPTLIPSRP